MRLRSSARTRSLVDFLSGVWFFLDLLKITSIEGAYGFMIHWFPESPDHPRLLWSLVWMGPEELAKTKWVAIVTARPQARYGSHSPSSAWRARSQWMPTAGAIMKNHALRARCAGSERHPALSNPPTIRPKRIVHMLAQSMSQSHWVFCSSMMGRGFSEKGGYGQSTVSNKIRSPTDTRCVAHSEIFCIPP